MNVSASSLAQLLRARIMRINKLNKSQMPVLDDYQPIIEYYFKLCFEQAIKSGEAISFPLIGNIQVIKKISKKGYAWDKKYDGKDYELIVHTDKRVDISVSDCFYQQIIAQVDGGMDYQYDVVNHSERLQEIIHLLNGNKNIGTKTRRNKITA